MIDCIFLFDVFCDVKNLFSRFEFFMIADFQFANINKAYCSERLKSTQCYTYENYTDENLFYEFG